MPLSYRVEGDVLVYTFTGDAPLNEAHAAFVDGMTAYRATSPDKVRVFMDITGSEENRPSAELQTMGQRIAGAVGDGRLAVVTATDLQFGQARMVQAEAEAEAQEIEVHVFRCAEDARSWLLAAD